MSELRIEKGQTVVVRPEAAHVYGDSGAASARGSFASALAGAVREHPISAALISMGSIWLFTGGSTVSLFGSADRTHRRRGGMRDELPARARGSAAPGASATRVTSGIDAARDGVLQAGSELGGYADETASEVGSAVSSATSQAARAVSTAYGRTGSAARDVADAVSGKASSAAHNVSDVVTREADHLQQSMSEFFERQPLALGALGLGLGAALATALPQRRVEDDLLGEASAGVREQAQSLASAQLSRARRLADRALDEMTHQARVQGLSDDSLAEMIREFREKLTNVLASAGESAKDEVGAASTANERSGPESGQASRSG